MAYWRVRRTSKEVRKVETLGPTWAQEAYYDESYESRTWGKLDPLKMLLKFSGERGQMKKPIPTFPDIGALLCCASDVYETYFSDILRGQVKTFPHLISGLYYTGFRPTAFPVGLIDMNQSVYSVHGEDAFGFAVIKLRRAPDDGLLIFACGDYRALIYSTIVGQEFYNTYAANGMTGLEFYPALE